MRRWVIAALTGALLTSALATSAGAVPQGQPFQEPFPVTCVGLGQVMVAEAPGNAPANAWTTSGLHVVLVSLDATFTPTTGEVQTFSKTYGSRAGLETRYSCIATFVDSTGTTVVNVVVAQIQPRS
jgi:hypothetical protein